MKFYLYQKNKFETDVLTNILTDYHIPYEIKENEIPIFSPIDDLPMFYLVTFDIIIDTTLEKFDYIKFLFEKQKKIIAKLNKCFKKKSYKKKVKENV